MKRTVIFLSIITLLVFVFSSCTSLRDCNGNKKTRLSNGVSV